MLPAMGRAFLICLHSGGLMRKAATLQLVGGGRELSTAARDIITPQQQGHGGLSYRPLAAKTPLLYIPCAAYICGNTNL